MNQKLRLQERLWALSTRIRNEPIEKINFDKEVDELWSIGQIWQDIDEENVT